MPPMFQQWRTPVFGLDIGGTLTKVCLFEPTLKLDAETKTTTGLSSNSFVMHLLSSKRYGESGYRVQDFELEVPGGRLHFICFLSSRFSNALHWTKERAGVREKHKAKRTKNETSRPRPTRRVELHVTGGGAHKFESDLRQELGVSVAKYNEISSLVLGLRFLLSLPGGCFGLKDPHFRTRVGTERNSLSIGATVPRPLLELQQKPFLVVNVGSGVSILLVDPSTRAKAKNFRKGNDSRSNVKRRKGAAGASVTTQPPQWRRVGGSSLGGATFLGLCRALGCASSFEEALKLAAEGDSKTVDLLVGDIYGKDTKLTGELANLRPSTLASSFGKLATGDLNKPRREDLALSTLVMISMNLAAIAHLHAKSNNVSDILFTGSFLAGGRKDRAETATGSVEPLARNVIAMRTFSFAVNFWSGGEINASFLTHEGFAGALGSLIQGAAEGPRKAARL